MHSHLTHAIVNRATGRRVMPATNVNHGLRLMDIHKYHWKEYCVKRLQYNPQPEKRLRGYGITKPGYLLIKYLADNPCAKMTDVVKHIMIGLFGELEYYGAGTGIVIDLKKAQPGYKNQSIYYQHFAYLFTPEHSNMTTYGKRTADRRWMHRFKGPDGVYRYHLTALGLDAANKIWQRHHYKWAKVA